MVLSLDEYKIIVESAPNLIWRSGVDAMCYYFNRTWLEYTGRTFEQEYGEGWTEGVHSEDLDRCISIYKENFSKRTPFEMEYRLRRHDGAWRWMNDRGVPVVDESGDFSGFVGSCLDVTERVEGHILKEMAQKDGLTGIFSRQYLMSLFDYEIEFAKRTGSELSVAMMDIDKFKLINDIYGHIGGDSALKMFASVVKDTLRQDDLFGRYGGDEFVVVFPNTSAITAKRIVERLRSQLKGVALKLDDAEVEISISVGFCELTDEKKPEEMIGKADIKMYEDKNSK